MDKIHILGLFLLTEDKINMGDIYLERLKHGKRGKDKSSSFYPRMLKEWIKLYAKNV